MIPMPDPAADAELVRRFHGRPFEAGTSGTPSTMIGHLDRWEAEQGDAPYLTVVDDAAVSTFRYREVARYSRGIAHWLRTALAPAPGRAIGLLPVNDAVSVLALYGVLRAGHPVLVLNAADPAARLREQLDALGVEVVLRGPGVPAERLPESVLLPRLSELPEPPDPPAGAGPPPLSGEADALYFGTSGSTAGSKMVAQTHTNAVANAAAVVRHHGLRPGDRLLGCLPVHHVNGVHFTLFGTLAAGAHAVLIPRFSPFGYPELLSRYRPRVASVVPSMLESLLTTWRRPGLPREFEYFVSAAAPLQTSTVRAVHERLGARVLQGYGLTETTNFSATLPADLSEAGYRRMMLDRDIPSIGAALHGNEITVLLPDGGRAPVGQVGELCIRGHNVMARYANNAEATAEAFRGGWFHSQDLGYETTDEDTGRRFLVITGRSKNIAKVRGETVSLEEVERVLRSVPGVSDAACAAVPDRLLGESLVAAVCAPAELTDQEIRDRLRALLPDAALPSGIVRLRQVPRTPTGKILRPALEDLLTGRARYG
jgi:acyl-CoA synthetase (AMP-forming)/AMP-acid ligase II